MKSDIDYKSKAGSMPIFQKSVIADVTRNLDAVETQAT